MIYHAVEKEKKPFYDALGTKKRKITYKFLVRNKGI